jgi:hypothetical protein
MSIMLASSKNVPSETSAEALRREIAERAQRAYDRSLRLRRIVIAASLTFSLGQCVYSIARPGASELLLSEAIGWGSSPLASLLAMSLVWNCRLHRDQSQQQYTAYLHRTRRLAEAVGNRLAPAA